MVASLSKSIHQEELSLVLGKDSLRDTGQKYLEFYKQYLSRFINQGKENRSIEETLNIAWDLFDILPREELKKIKQNMYEKYSVKEQ